MSRTAEATDVAAQVDNLVDNLEQAVWAGVEAVQAARKRLVAAQSAAPALNRLMAGLPTVEGVMRSTYARLANGDPVDPDTFAAGLAAAAPTVDAMRVAAILTASGVDGARNELTAAQHANQHEALAVLDRTVKELAAIARPLLDAANALDGSRRFAEIGMTQVALERAAVAHTRIRTVQLAITHDAMDGHLEQLLRVYGIVADTRPCLPGVVAMAGGVSAGYQPEVPDINDGQASLRFITRPDLEPWVPTYRQAKAAKAALDQHTRDLRDQAENPTRPDRDAGNDPQVVVRGAIGRPPVIGSR